MKKHDIRLVVGCYLMMAGFLGLLWGAVRAIDASDVIALTIFGALGVMGLGLLIVTNHD